MLNKINFCGENPNQMYRIFVRTDICGKGFVSKGAPKTLEKVQGLADRIKLKSPKVVLLVLPADTPLNQAAKKLAKEAERKLDKVA